MLSWKIHYSTYQETGHAKTSLSAAPLPYFNIQGIESQSLSHLPCLKQLLQSYGTQLGLEVLVAQSRQAVRAGVWWGKGPHEGLRIRGVAMGRQFTP